MRRRAATVAAASSGSVALAYIWCGFIAMHPVNDLEVQLALGRLRPAHAHPCSSQHHVAASCRYYIARVCKAPSLFFQNGPFGRLIQERCAALKQPYCPTPWAINRHTQTMLSGRLELRWMHHAWPCMHVWTQLRLCHWQLCSGTAVLADGSLQAAVHPHTRWRAHRAGLV